MIRLWVDSRASVDAIVSAVREEHPKVNVGYTTHPPWHVTLTGRVGYHLGGRMVTLPQVVVELPVRPAVA